MKYTYKELKGLSTGVQQNLINEAGKKVTSKDTIELLTLPDVESARIMSIAMAYNGLQSTFQALDDYTNFLGAYIQEEEPENKELKAEMDNLGGIINAELNDAYLKMVPYIMTDKEIQEVIDKGLTKEQECEVLAQEILDIITADEESNDDRSQKVLSQTAIMNIVDKLLEKVLDEDDEDEDIVELIQTLFSRTLFSSK